VQSRSNCTPSSIVDVDYRRPDPTISPTEKQRPTHQTALCRCIPCLPGTFAHGAVRPLREGRRLRVSAIPRRGRVPLSAPIFVADHLLPAAKKVGVHIEEGQRFALHNLRHSLSDCLVNKAKVEPKTVQGVLRHADVQMTLDL
jgi:integrase